MCTVEYKIHVIINSLFNFIHIVFRVVALETVTSVKDAKERKMEKLNKIRRQIIKISW